MKQSLFLLTLGVFLAMTAGFMLYPHLYEMPAAPLASSAVPGGQPQPAQPSPGEPLPPLPTQEGIVANEDGGVTIVGVGGEGDGTPGAPGVGVSEDDGAIVDSWDDDSWEEDEDASSDTPALAGERDPDSYMPEEMGQEVQRFLEREVPVDPSQAELPGLYSQGDQRKVRRAAEKLARVLKREAER